MIEERDRLLIKISGETRKNEAPLVKKMLSPYLNREERSVVVDLADLLTYEPVALLGILNGIKKEIDFSKGELNLMKIRDIDIVISTHEHFDHIGANRYFQEHALISAHRFAATKIAVKDMEKALQNAKKLLEDAKGVEVVHKEVPLAVQAGTK